MFIPNCLFAQDFELVSGPQLIGEPIDSVNILSIPANAVSMAVADLGGIPAADQPFQRYIWIPSPNKQRIGAVCYAVNLSVSQASTIIKPKVLNKSHMLRFDLRVLAPQESQLAKMLVLWERLGNDPYFHINATANDALPTDAIVIKSDLTDPAGSIRFKAGGKLWFKTNEGLFFLWNGTQWISDQSIIVNNPKKVSTYGAHCGLEQSVLLQGLTKSNAAVVRYDYFIAKVLTTLDDGLYYDFVGIVANPGGGKTSQEAFFASLGVDEKIIENLRSDQRAAMFRSNVTGKPRRIDAFQGPNVRPGVGSGLITVTRDMADENIGPNGDPFRNLLVLKDDAREVIAERPNGMHIFALFDGKGNLQRAAPDNVVKDHSVPAPHTARLQPSISCIRCHGPNQGFQPFRNEVQVMRNGLLDIFDDLQSRKAIPETLDRLAGLYAGDLTKAINRGRDDYADAVFITTEGMSVSEVSAAVSTIYGNYYYDMIDAQVALRELGFDVPKEHSVTYLNQFVPPLQRDVLGISPEDPIIGALKSGLSINRSQWEQIYADMAFRGLQTLKAQQKATQK